ncbi:MAG TPA: hypothetical protein VIG88_08910, partial [Lysobacter sp.]
GQRRAGSATPAAPRRPVASRQAATKPHTAACHSERPLPVPGCSAACGADATWQSALEPVAAHASTRIEPTPSPACIHSPATARLDAVDPGVPQPERAGPRSRFTSRIW